MKIKISYQKKRVVFCLVLLAIFLLPFFQKAIAETKENNKKVVANIKSIETKVAELDAVSKELQNAPNKLKNESLWVSIAIIITIVIAIWIFLWLAICSRQAIVQNADDKSEVVEFLMKQTLGLPQGTVRGILALTTALVFAGSVFYVGFDDVPESVKIITALVFGYYFAKKAGETKEIIEALQGKTKQRALLKQEASAALAEARAEGAATYAKNKFEEATKLINEGNLKESASEAISNYRKAKEIASEAEKVSIVGKRQEAEVTIQESNKKFNELSNHTRKRIDELIALKIDTPGITALWETARVQADKGNFEEANKTLERVKSMVDARLEEYDEARKLYEEKLKEEQRDKIKEARDNLDSSSVLDIKGDKLIETLLSIIGVLGDKDRGLISLFKKRVSGDKFEPSDIKMIYEGLKESGKTKMLTNIVDISANSAGIKLPPIIRDSIETLGLLDKLVLGDDNIIDNVFRSDFADKDQSIDRSDFEIFVNKIRKNIVDSVIEDSVKKGLPEDVEFDDYKKALKSSQKDEDGKGTLNSIYKVIDIGETILSFTPIGGAAKIIGPVAKGLFKIFG